MPLLIYRPKLFSNTAENLQFRLLCEELHRRIRYADEHNKPEICLFVGNFNFAEKEFDAFLIKKNAILLIEFKNYGGHLVIDNNKWHGTFEGQEFIIKGGSDNKTPLQQARNNRNAFCRNLIDCGALNKLQAEKVSSVIVFNHDAKIENKLKFNIQTWLHLCDNNGFFGVAESIINSEMNFSAVDLKHFADRIVLDDDYIVEEFSDTDFLDTWNDEEELQKYSDFLAGVVHFHDAPDPIRANQNNNQALESEQDSEHASTPILPQDAGQITVETNIEEESKVDAISFDKVPKMVSDYISLVQDAVLTGIKYEIYDCIESHPSVDFDINNRYLVKVNIEPADSQALNLENFIHRDVYFGKDCLYWCIGEYIQTIKASQRKVNFEKKKHEFRHSVARLAPWLDSFIFNQLNASYDPRYNKFNYNDELGEEEAKIYLGTYFPRSYAENFLIFDNLFQNSMYRAKIEAKRSLVVFSIGSGTGGDIIGLLTAINKYMSSEVSIKVISLDVNKYSLNLQKLVVEKYKSYTDGSIDYQQFEGRISSKETLRKYAELVSPDGVIDFLLFSKIGCELHGKRVFPGLNVYKVLLDTFTKKISDVGIVSLLDVTTKVDGKEFMPTIMNRGVNSFITENPEYSTLVPLSCCAYERKCMKPCFYQQEFFVSHSRKTNDLSKICYRIVAHTNMCDSIVDTKDKRFVVTPSKLKSEVSDAYCYMSLKCTEEKDAFNVTN